MWVKEVKKRESIISAIQEFNTLGRAEFLQKYGFKNVRIYFLVYEGKLYDCKPILCAAYQIEHGMPLLDHSSNGVAEHIKPHLEGMGFKVFAIEIQESSVVLAEEAGANELWEGAQHKITVNRYERSPEARKQCIEHHGCTCCICHFDFAAVYGDEFLGFIHVHHILPLAQKNTEHKVDPKEDLRPVCPNCHAVLHFGGETRTIEDVRKLVLNRANRNSP